VKVLENLRQVPPTPRQACGHLWDVTKTTSCDPRWGSGKRSDEISKGQYATAVSTYSAVIPREMIHRVLRVLGDERGKDSAYLINRNRGMHPKKAHAPYSNWRARRESNPHSLGSKPSALSVKLRAHGMIIPRVGGPDGRATVGVSCELSSCRMTASGRAAVWSGR
jgi:hypothetical protein